MRDMVVVGLGELGRLYGAAALRAGLRVTPITRGTEPERALAPLPPDTPILIAVGEDALDGVLEGIPKPRAGALILLQNELFPSRWRRHGLTPTVFVAWLLKKAGTPLTVARPSPVYGPHAALMCELNAALDIPAVTLDSEAALHQALVEKYAFILAINALGLLRDRTLSRWLQEDPLRVRALADEAAQLGGKLCETEAIDRAACQRATEQAMHALGAMSARGRTAEQRVRRALAQASEHGLTLPELTRAFREAGR